MESLARLVKIVLRENLSSKEISHISVLIRTVPVREGLNEISFVLSDKHFIVSVEI